jgi:hypothetical protein
MSMIFSINNSRRNGISPSRSVRSNIIFKSPLRGHNSDTITQIKRMKTISASEMPMGTL